MVIKLTESGRKKFEDFLIEAKTKRKEILDAGLDTANETQLPDENAIIADIEWFEEDYGNFKGYNNAWGITDNPKYDLSITLYRDKDYN